jgi:diaminopimelate decarboxylase
MRVNPDVDAGTHAKITTGRKENKFGIDIDLARAAYAHAASKPNVRVVGVAMHIGSQILSLEPYRGAIRKLRGLVDELRADGHDITRLDLGGGYGIVYRQQSNERPFAVDAYMTMVREETAGLGCALSFEPGRCLVGNAGVLLGEVILVKPGVARTFVVVDAAMNDLIRPTLYEAWHDILPVKEPRPGAASIVTDIVGPICESGDYLAQNRAMPPLAPGDGIVVKSAGAYGAVMASTYNTRPLAPEVLVDGDRYEVIRPRQSLDELIAADRVPGWL